MRTGTNNQAWIALAGRVAIEEAARLLNHLGFSPNVGAHAEGDYVAVTADPVWEAGGRAFSVAITCFPYGHRRVDWKGMPVLLEGEGGRRPDFSFVELNARGQAVTPRLAPGRYRLAAFANWGRSDEPLAPPGERLPWRGQYLSNDRRVRFTVVRRTTRELDVAATTDDPALANARVGYLLRAGLGATPIADEVTLTPNESGVREWTGHRTYPPAPALTGAAIAAAAQPSLIFGILPSSSD